MMRKPYKVAAALHSHSQSWCIRQPFYIGVSECAQKLPHLHNIDAIWEEKFHRKHVIVLETWNPLVMVIVCQASFPELQIYIHSTYLPYLQLVS